MKYEAVLTRRILSGGVVSLMVFAGCGGGTSQSLNDQPPSPSNRTPAITTISPNSTMAGGAAFTLTVNGTNFVSTSMVNFAETASTTTFVSPTQLTAAIPAAAIASAGNAPVTVTNPAPGGGTSNTVSLAINSGTNPIPTIGFLDPSCAPFGAQTFTLAVMGTNLVPSSVVRWNGKDLPTTLNGGPLLAQVPGSDIATAGTVAVTVFNPAPGGGISNPATFTIAAGGVGPTSVAVDPTGKFAYVADEGCPDAFGGSVSMYTINSTTGTLTSVGPPVTTGDFGADSVAVDPSGKFAYVGNWGEGDTAGSVSMYTINSTTGALVFTGSIVAPCEPPPSPGSCAPWSVAVHPSGRFVYVANEGGFAPTSISMYAIDATTGALAFTGLEMAGGRAFSATVDPTGKFAYAATESGLPEVVSMYTINGTTGTLTSIGTIPAGTDINGGLVHASVAVDPAGNFVYVTNSGSNDVSIYTINGTTGALTSIGTIPAGTSPASVAVDPTGKFAYVANSGSNNVSMYTLDSTTGALTLIGSVATGSSPTSIAIHPTGKFAYVTNSGSNDISIYSIDPGTGALTLIGTTGT